jgi:hypothetical protein
MCTMRRSTSSRSVSSNAVSALQKMQTGGVDLAAAYARPAYFSSHGGHGARMRAAIIMYELFTGRLLAFRGEFMHGDESAVESYVMARANVSVCRLRGYHETSTHIIATISSISITIRKDESAVERCVMAWANVSGWMRCLCPAAPTLRLCHCVGTFAGCVSHTLCLPHILHACCCIKHMASGKTSNNNVWTHPLCVRVQCIGQSSLHWRLADGPSILFSLIRSL